MKQYPLIAKEAISKTRASGFIRGSKHLETIKALGLQPRAFICFSVFGTPDKTLALINILHKKFQIRLGNSGSKSHLVDPTESHIYLL